MDHHNSSNIHLHNSTGIIEPTQQHFPWPLSVTRKEWLDPHNNTSPDHCQLQGRNGWTHTTTLLLTTVSYKEGMAGPTQQHFSWPLSVTRKEWLDPHNNTSPDHCQLQGRNGWTHTTTLLLTTVSYKEGMAGPTQQHFSWPLSVTRKEWLDPHNNTSPDHCQLQGRNGWTHTTTLPLTTVSFKEWIAGPTQQTPTLTTVSLSRFLP